MRHTKCQRCKRDLAMWAMQYIGEDRPSFYLLGSHIRGYKLTKVCESCKQLMMNNTDNITREEAEAELRAAGVEPSELVNDFAERLRALVGQYRKENKPIPPLMQEAYNQLKDKPRHRHVFKLVSYDEEAGFGVAQCQCGDVRYL